MILNFKKYLLLESVNEEFPKEGDFVVVDDKIFDGRYKNLIGILNKISSHNTAPYNICFDIVDKTFNDFYFFATELKYWSENKEDLEAILVGQKFGL